MAQASKTFRIFVSSTFSDLKEERNALQKKVFPKLRELCIQHGCRFQAIDLRWGVSEEAALDQQTMNICLEELRRCQKTTPRPNFIVLLGDRYGWRPLPAQIEAEEFEAILDKVPAQDKSLLQWSDRQTDKQMGWYRKDENAVPAEYRLRSREIEFPKDATDEEKKVIREKEAREWGESENRMRSILLEPIDRFGWASDDPRHVKYETSATHQEILKGALSPEVKDAKGHVFGFFRQITNLDTLERDLDKPQSDPDKEAGNFVDSYLGQDGKRHINWKAHERVQSLKNEELKPALAGNIHEYVAHWTGSGITTEHIGTLPESLENCLKLNEDSSVLSNLCVDVWKRLSCIILKEIEVLEAIEPLEKEIEDHCRFGEERAKFFVGREDILGKIRDYIKGDNSHPLAIFGESGSGKTALMARAVEDAKKEHPEAKIIFRFIGATPGSSDIRSLLKGLCEEIYKRFNYEKEKEEQIAKVDGRDEESQKKRSKIEEEYTIPEDIQKLPETFRRFLSKVPKRRKLIIFLDALDQLSEADNARSLNWLPGELPEGVRLVTSVLLGECLTQLKKRLPVENLVELKPMPLEDGSKLLDLWLKEAGRTLQDSQRKEILDKFQRFGLPLYLKLAFEEVRRWNSYSPRIELSQDVPNIIRDLLRRLSSDANHGKMMVSRSLAYLAVAKNGLTEDELLDILSQDDEVLKDFMERSRHIPPEKRLPVVVWSRFYFDMEPYLTERSADRSSLLSFYHRQVEEVTTEDYLAGNARREHHRMLAQYFQTRPLWLKKDKEKNPNLRKVSELPYQETHGEMWKELEGTLTDLDFVDAKCKSGMVYDIIGDYSRAEWSWPGQEEERRKEEERQKRIEKYVKEIIAYAKAWSNARDLYRKSPDRYPMPGADEIPLPKPPETVPIRIWEDEAKEGKQEWTPLERVQVWAHFVNNTTAALLKKEASTFQLAYNSADSGPVVEAMEKNLEQGEGPKDAWLKVKNRPVYNPHPTCLKTLEWHTNGVNAVALTPDGKCAISGSWDNTLRVWDIESGQCLKTLEGHTAWVETLALTPDGKCAISGSGDMTLRVWEIESGQCLKTLRGHTNGVNAVALTPDGKYAISGSWDKTLRVWEIESGQCLKTLRGHTSEVNAVALTPDGKCAVSSGSWDMTLRVWEIERGQCLNALEEHTDWVRAVALTPDGKCAISGSGDKTLRVWEIESGQCLKTLEGHTDWVRAVALTPDGKCAISGSGDKTLRVWEIESGQCLKTLRGHTSEVLAVALTPDGKCAVSSGSDDKTLRVWEIESGQCVKTLEGHTSYFVEVVAVTPDGKCAVSGSWDKTLRVWEIESGQCVKTLEGHTDWVRAVALTPDGKCAISGSDDKTLRVWEIESGQCLKTLEGHTNGVNAIALTPDGRCAISGSGDKTLRVWEIESGQCLKTLRGHTSEVRAVALTPDGKCAISGSGDKTLRVWEIESGQCLLVYGLPGNHVSCLAARLPVVMAGTVSGRIEFLKIEKFSFPDIAVVTATHLWRHGGPGHTGHWDDSLTAVCYWCGKRFKVVDAMIGNETTCPMKDCGKPLKFNPFVCDNRGRF